MVKVLYLTFKTSSQSGETVPLIKMQRLKIMKKLILDYAISPWFHEFANMFTFSRLSLKYLYLTKKNIL